ncbi:hypothetical protein SBOR_4765 [Sclerotinia borealis F-4128]|uniref:DUF6604 domain-containing protein n=1 Tax=Sclerotinia borealis (strain F-4128) TaxID=1432307 RepID=W9CJR2_SCLBF|nr:hypothetical protein SBOR_4765 [Sclerotinia borealis F-4128]
MLPGYLYSTYKRYKEDTSTFIRWLSQTGESCGYSSIKTPTPIVEAAPKSARLKGKARKAAKQASSGDSLSRPATAVKQSSRIVDIPISIIRAGLRAISARRKCTSFFTDLTAEDDIQRARTNESHEFFTDLMNKVLMVLQPSFAVATEATSTRVQNAKCPEEDIANRFAQLEVEDLEDTDDHVPVSTATNSTEAEAVYELNISESTAHKEEKLFAIVSLFKDLQELRNFIEGIWKDYNEKRIDLITAAATTNVAFQLGIRAQDEITANFPGLDDYDYVIKTVLTALRGDATGNEVEVSETVGDFVFTPAHTILDNFCDILKPNEVPVMKRGYLGVYLPLIDRSKKSSLERFREDQILLLELLPEFSFTAKYKLKHFAIDELTRGIGEMTLSKKIPVWLTFATTVLLDIYHTMREDVALAYLDSQLIVKTKKAILDKHIAFSRNFTHPATWPAKNQKVLQGLATDIEQMIMTDIILPCKREQFKKNSFPPPTSEEDFYLYRHHPILCGILAFRATLLCQSFGVAYCNAVGTVVFPAQFYNALKQKPNPLNAWPLMDQAIAVHTPERVFVGGAPQKMQACFRQACLMLGCSPTQFAANRRPGRGSVASKNGPRGLKETSPIGDLFRKGFEKGSITLTLHIENILNDQARDEELSRNPKAKSLKYEWRRTKRLTSLQFLEALTGAISLELSDLNFNYFELHQQSVMLLRKVNVELKADLQNVFGPNYLENESQLPFVGLYVVMAACNTEKTAENIGLRGTSSLLLEKAGEIVEKFLSNLKNEAYQNE